MRWSLLMFVLLVTIAHTTEKPLAKPKAVPVDVPLSHSSDKFRIVGRLGQPFGTVFTLQGIVVDGPGKGHEGGPNFCVQHINGKATQQHLQIKLTDDSGKYNGQLPFPKIEIGKTYEFEAYETGGFVGMPTAVNRRHEMGYQMADLYFCHELHAFTGKAIPPIAWSPADFVDREALLAGKAVTRRQHAYINGDGWQLLVDAAPWPPAMEGKTVESFGTVKKTDAVYHMANHTTRLVHLEDQKGRPVELRGTAWSNSGHWWLDYRGTRVEVENMAKLPGWNARDMHAAPVRITGTLDEVELPDDRERVKKRYIVRQAKWQALDALLGPER